MTKSNVLQVSHATKVAPRTQQDRERGILAAGARGESHLHVSTFAPGEVLSLGAFHRQPSAENTQGEASVWRRTTGGRPCPAGNGTLVVTLGLPHRSALVAVDRTTLAPAQVINRCVRGVLHALRALGVDVVYPGLDLLTHERRALAVLSFIETTEGALFQAILPVEGSLAETPFLLDRVDPAGVVPITMLSENEATGLGAVLGASRRDDLAPDRFVRHLAAGYADAFGTDSHPLDDAMLEALATISPGEGEPLPPPPAPRGRSARAHGLLGDVEAWASLDAAHALTDLLLTGDYIAPLATPRRLSKALRGAATPSECEARITSFLDRDLGYVLGLRPPELVDLVQRSVTVSS